eukprot:1420904-Alexandrium_andersonii.AAC.1
MAVSIDGYLREQDAASLKVKHLSWAKDGLSVAAAFGTRESMERSKTGWEQGVVFSEPYVVGILRRRALGRAPEENVFLISSQNYA